MDGWISSGSTCRCLDNASSCSSLRAPVERLSSSSLLTSSAVTWSFLSSVGNWEWHCSLALESNEVPRSRWTVKSTDFIVSFFCDLPSLRYMNSSFRVKMSRQSVKVLTVPLLLLLLLLLPCCHCCRFGTR